MNANDSTVVVLQGVMRHRAIRNEENPVQFPPCHCGTLANPAPRRGPLPRIPFYTVATMCVQKISHKYFWQNSVM
eukprot:2914116-Amphidinium_carterae.1